MNYISDLMRSRNCSVVLPKHIYTTPSQANIDINVHPVKSQSVNKMGYPYGGS